MPRAHTASNGFDTVRAVGLALPGVEATMKYDGSLVLKVGGSFLAGLATHRLAEPNTLVVSAGFDESVMSETNLQETLKTVRVGTIQER